MHFRPCWSFSEKTDTSNETRGNHSQLERPLPARTVHPGRRAVYPWRGGASDCGRQRIDRRLGRVDEGQLSSGRPHRVQGKLRIRGGLQPRHRGNGLRIHSSSKLRRRSHRELVRAPAPLHGGASRGRSLPAKDQVLSRQDKIRVCRCGRRSSGPSGLSLLPRACIRQAGDRSGAV